jgi:predicted DNA binding CopG/RHH family protein
MDKPTLGYKLFLKNLEPKKKRVHFNLTWEVEDLEAIKAEAKSLGLPMTAFFRCLWETYKDIKGGKQ